MAFQCWSCNKRFGSQHALDQHCGATGHWEDWEEEEEEYCEGDEELMPDPPVDEPGHWVPREKFEGRKSFGFYWCNCGRSWVSAQGWKQYKQGCQGCNRESLAVYLWVNEKKYTGVDLDDPDRVVRNREGPHDSDRCEACRAGVCDALGGSARQMLHVKPCQMHSAKRIDASLGRPLPHVFGLVAVVAAVVLGLVAARARVRRDQGNQQATRTSSSWHLLDSLIRSAMR